MASRRIVIFLTYRDRATGHSATATCSEAIGVQPEEEPKNVDHVVGDDEEVKGTLLRARCIYMNCMISPMCLTLRRERLL